MTLTQPDPDVLTTLESREHPGLDTNSPYHYTPWFRDFADTSLIATLDGELVG